MIGLAVDDDQIFYIQEAQRAKEAWDNLPTVYENPGTANKTYL